MMLYKIVLCLFCFGAVVTGLNSSGLFTTVLPEQNIQQYDSAQVEELTEAATGDVSPLFTINFVIIAVKSVLMGMVSVLTIIPLMLSFGVPLWIAAMIQSPIWFVSAVGVYQFVTGNRVEE